MENKNNHRWLCIHNYVYASIQKKSALLYNTRNGQFITVKIQIQIDLINRLHDRKNLGTVLIDEDVLQNPDLKNFIDEAIQKEIFHFIEYHKNQPKPIELMPVLNIQRDVEKLKKENDRSLGEDIIYYLTELSLSVNNQCRLQCNFCSEAAKQFTCCTSKNSTALMEIPVLQSIAKQIKVIPYIKINILGGNIFQYPQLKQIPVIFFDKKQFIHYWFHYLNFQSGIIESGSQFNIIIDLPVKFESLQICINHLPEETATFHFIVNTRNDVEAAQNVIEKLSIKNFEYHPFYTNANRKFFEENVFLNQDDIMSETISQRKIFCNQALNSNCFGKLNISSSGDVYANSNTEKLGSIHSHSLLHLIHSELETNTAWRKTRIEKPCNECLYQYLCPPPSNYESVIGKPNLCHVTP